MPVNPGIREAQRLIPPPSLSTIIHAVSIVFATPKEKILQATRGRGNKNIARSVVIYCCRNIAGLPLNKIAEQFCLSHYGSVSVLVTRFGRLNEDNSEIKELIRKVENLFNK